MSTRETELKFEVPAGVRDALEAELLRRGATRVSLDAIYYDTADEALARARLALRLRREDDRWVQTLKGGAATSARRSEHEVEVAPPAAGSEPTLDIGRHHGSDDQRALSHVLDRAGGAAVLHEVFRTRVIRLRGDLALDGARVEAAFDEGEVVAGERRAPIRELELELKAGDPAALIAIARTWSAHAGLWLSSVSKTERGHRLLRGERFGAAQKAGRVAIGKRDGDEAALQAIVGSCLAQVLANGSDIADGCDDIEQVHQLRVGLRRLRTVLGELGALDPRLAADALEAPLADAFRRLGEARDAVAVAATAGRLLAAAGAPLPAWAPDAAAIDTAAVVRAPALQDALLRLIGYTLAPPHPGPLASPASRAAPHGITAAEASEDATAGGGADAAVPPHTAPRAGPENGRAVCSGDDRALRRRVVARLERLHRAVVRDGRRFERLDDAARHRTRKRLKRLRYLAELTADLFRAREVRRYLARLEPAQDALGEHVDCLFAIERFEHEAQRRPAALWSVGWLRAHLDVTVRSSRQALRRIGRARRFWR